MKQYTKEEEERLRSLGRKFREDKEKSCKRNFNKLPLAVRDFIESADINSPESVMYSEFKKYIEEKGAPSGFIEEKMPEIFDGYINSKHKKHLLYTLDHLHERIYTVGYYRRSMRSGSAEIIADFSLRKIKAFATRDYVPDDVCDYLEDKVPEEVLGNKMFLNINGALADIIAAEIDFGNERLIGILTDCINGDNDVVMDREYISAIVRSHAQKMYELLGKLLCAARLQEGLRQAICETMDEGTPDAFIYLTKVIIDNNFIRFSSVKRAFAVWLGFLQYDVTKLDRISNKMSEYVYSCITDRTKIEEFLDSEDSLKIHVALWSIGFYEVRDLVDKIYEIVEKGSRHQVISASFSVGIVHEDFLYNRCALPVIRKYRDDNEVLAGYMNYFMKGYDSKLYNRNFSATDYFTNAEEAEEYYDILKGIYNDISGKKATFDPYIFEWYNAELTKSQLIIRMAYIAATLKDDAKKDEICGMLKDASPDDRHRIIEYILGEPNTKIQRETLTAALCDKAEYVRKTAYDTLEKCKDKITSENYMQMEEMLRYKAADAREKLIKLLMEQDDEALCGTIERLLSDKKEEKRTAALDMVINLTKEETRKELFEKVAKAAAAIENPSTKEKILLESICPSDTAKENAETMREALFTENDIYEPGDADGEMSDKCIKTFMDYFPDSDVGRALNSAVYKKGILGLFKDVVGNKKDCASFETAYSDLKKFGAFIKEHEKDEFRGCNGEMTLVGGNVWSFYTDGENGERTIPFKDMWMRYIKENIPDKCRFYRMYLLSMDLSEYGNIFMSDEIVEKLYGNGFSKQVGFDYRGHAARIISELIDLFVPKKDRQLIALSVAMYFVEAVPLQELYKTNSDRYYRHVSRISAVRISRVIASVDRMDDEMLSFTFPLMNKLYRKHRAANPSEKEKTGYYDGYYHQDPSYPDYMKPLPQVVIYAGYRNIITKGQMYSILFDEKNIGGAIEFITSAIIAIREKDRLVSARQRGYYWMNRLVGNICEKADDGFLKFIDEVYEKVIGEILYIELRRGDSQTRYSEKISKIRRIYGIENFVAILSALGKETLDRSMYYGRSSKKSALSMLLAVCIPTDDDNADKLAELIKKTDITEKRLIEASLYSTEWLEIAEKYLGWDGFASGCYYFIAHMDEYFDNKKQAVIARYTPLSGEELRAGAFDVEWFKSAYKMLGQKRFDIIYGAAKYISGGTKHSRARKYADAALGKYEPDEIREKIIDKRNKDLLMAYALIPIKNEDDICSRYTYIQQFLKESKKFGAQRSASEKQAVEVALQNLSINAGYADVTRLTLRMETKVIEDCRELFDEKEIEDITVKLAVDDYGKTSVVVTKAGKKLKSVPTKYKKDEYIKKLSDTKKKLTDQYRRTKQMFEQAMEYGEKYTSEELALLKDNPVAYPIIRDLVFAEEKSGKIGFFDNGVLTDHEGKETKLKKKDLLTVAHPYHIYKDGHWSEYQKILFEKGVIQPFKQVFRELYVKTDEEMEMLDSRRYSGNQIQPKKTMAALKSRRWVCDIEDGLQKIYYKENIVATIYAMADWFSPADIEAPTLEWVAFYDRKTSKRKKIKDIPDIIFSEVMRDVDLAVSVAHAGSVDPETSHSTIEMRAALLGFTLPLFKLSNVKVEKNHAHIKGKYGNYSVHLGSGVVHKMGGTMINILPVHSQHRGKIFLPFADEDPKTAEILTKVLFLAQDSKIKDPSILSQL